MLTFKEWYQIGIPWIVFFIIVIMTILCIDLVLGLNQSSLCENIGYNLSLVNDLEDCQSFWAGWNTTGIQNITYINITYSYHNTTTNQETVNNYYNQTLDSGMDIDDYYTRTEINEELDEFRSEILGEIEGMGLNTTVDQLDLIKEQNRHTEDMARIDANKTKETASTESTASTTDAEKELAEIKAQLHFDSLDQESKTTTSKKATTSSTFWERNLFLIVVIIAIILMIWMFFGNKIKKMIQQQETPPQYPIERHYPPQYPTAPQPPAQENLTVLAMEERQKQSDEEKEKALSDLEKIKKEVSKLKTKNAEKSQDPNIP